MKRCCALLGASCVLVAVVSSAAASGVNSPTLTVKVPPPGGVSLSVITLHGRVRPGSSIPRQVNLRNRLPLSKAANLPRPLAVYDVVHISTSRGGRVTIELGLVVLRPTAARRSTSSVSNDYPPVSEAAKREVATVITGFFLEHWFVVNDEEQKQDTFEFEADKAGKLHFHENNNMIDDDVKPDGSTNLPPLDLFEKDVPLTGNYADGHNFGWKASGSPSGSANAATVLNSLDELMKQIVQTPPTDTVNPLIRSKAETLESSAGFPNGSLIPATSSTAPGGTAPVIFDNTIDFNPTPCTPGGGTLEVSWEIHGAQPRDNLVVAMTGPGVPARAELTIQSDGSASAKYPISGSGTWTTTVVSIGGEPAPDKNTSNSASAACH